MGKVTKTSGKWREYRGWGRRGRLRMGKLKGGDEGGVGGRAAQIR